MKKNFLITAGIAILLLVTLLIAMQFMQEKEKNEIDISNCGEGTVIYKVDSLCWQKAIMPSKAENWDEANNYCNNLTLAEKDDWRLPTKNELVTLIDKSKIGLTIDPAYFPDTDAGNYWTSTPGQYENSHQYIGFKSGFEGTAYDFQKGYSVRCIRDKGLLN